MTRADPPARMPQVHPGDLTAEAREFIGRWTGGIFRDADSNPPLLTFAHHPRLAQAFTTFNIHLLSTSTLSAKERQIAIMRTAWLTKATYMWSSHLDTSLRSGLSPDMFDPIKVGASDPYFTPFESAIITATDELVDDKKVSEAQWNILMTQWDNQQMIDFIFTVGCYVLTAGFMRSAGIERRPELLELAERYGAP